MKQVWQCDFCWETGTKEETQEHEKGCVRNPVNKNCESCSHYYFESGYEGEFYDKCKLDKDILNIIEDRLTCEFYKEK